MTKIVDSHNLSLYNKAVKEERYEDARLIAQKKVEFHESQAAPWNDLEARALLAATMEAKGTPLPA